MIAVRGVSEATKLEMARLGGYTIVRKLAKGGMAEIYLARSVGPEGFEKLVVLKRILPRYAENPKFVQLFLDEAKLAASLDHPHIVHVYDMGRIDGHYFFTMEYVHGQDTRSILRKASHHKAHPIPIAIAVQIARTMAAALHHAHERKQPDGASRDVVHRDVSPSNILVSYDGAIKLADFGVAKAASSSVRTRTGALKGKVGYMSPEQARGMPIDRRSDIFSLGVVLWELVAMRRLFKTDNDLATIQAIINATPPLLAELRDDCPPELDRVVRRALEKDPATRYQTAQQLQRDLEELARELKLDQSSISLSHYMNELFADEIAAWRDAQAAGATVTDFMFAHSNPTPVSESDFSLEDGDDEPDDDDEVDDEPSDVAPAPQPPLAGTLEEPSTERRAKMSEVDEPDDATDFGPPPVMESGVGPLPKRPATVNVIPRIQPPVLPKTDTLREDNPFDNATTRLQPNLLAEAAFANEAPTAVGTVGAFVDEAPTVSAPPDILQKAFAETDETVQAGPRYAIPDTAYPTPVDKPGLYDKEAATSPFHKAPVEGSLAPPNLPSVPHVSSLPAMLPQPGKPPVLPGAARPGAIFDTPMHTPIANPPPPPSYPGAPTFAAPEPGEPTGFEPDPPGDGQFAMMPPPGAFGPGPMAVGSFPPGAMAHAPHLHGYTGNPMQPRTPPVGVAAMGYPSYDFDPNLAIDLAPQRRWVVIAGIAVGVMVLLILLIVIFSRGDEEEEVVPDEPPAAPAPRSEAAPAPAPAVVARPAPAPAPVAKVEPKREPPPPEPVKAELPKITRQPPTAIRRKRR